LGEKIGQTLIDIIYPALTVMFRPS